MHAHWLLPTSVLWGGFAPLHAQGLRADPTAAAARAALRPVAPPPGTIPWSSAATKAPADSTARPHAGLVLAYFVDQSREGGEGRLENYIAIRLALGAVTFMTVYVATGD